jgi:hypothetical protein
MALCRGVAAEQLGLRVGDLERAAVALHRAGHAKALALAKTLNQAAGHAEPRQAKPLAGAALLLGILEPHLGHAPATHARAGYAAFGHLALADHELADGRDLALVVVAERQEPHEILERGDAAAAQREAQRAADARQGLDRLLERALARARLDRLGLFLLKHRLLALGARLAPRAFGRLRFGRLRQRLRLHQHAHAARGGHRDLGAALRARQLARDLG